jgi:predicted DNA-binding ribbon-helix-helix protein
VIRKLRFGDSIKPRTATLSGHKTSFRLEDGFWAALEEIALQRALSVNKLVADINDRRSHANLSSVIRLFVLEHYRRLAKKKLSTKQRR